MGVGFRVGSILGSFVLFQASCFLMLPREPNDPLNKEYALNYRGLSIMI